MEKKNNRVLVTGAAGFIGFHLCRRLISEGYEVVGLDNLNEYYDPALKYGRLEELGVSSKNIKENNPLITIGRFHFVRMDIQDKEKLHNLFKEFKFDKVVNLAAQAGVRYSIENPDIYVESNVVGFLNILECCRQFKIKHLIYASSSSVYGQNSKIPFSTEDSVDNPISLYAATKKSNELMAHTYSHLYGFKTTGLRFFTVYGPWGRPDMAMFLFTDAIVNGKPIKIFNHGNLERDFTYIDDIIEGVLMVIEKNTERGNYNLYNIGNSKPVKLWDFIEKIEEELGVTAQKEMLPMQPGDVSRTWADVSQLEKDFGYKPTVSIGMGVKIFISWYKNYYL